MNKEEYKNYCEYGKTYDAFVIKLYAAPSENLSAYEEVGKIYCTYRLDHGHVETFEIHPDWQNKKLGTSLMNLAQDVFIRSGFTEVQLCVRPIGNISSKDELKAIYRKLGFVGKEDSNIFKKDISTYKYCYQHKSLSDIALAFGHTAIAEFIKNLDTKKTLPPSSVSSLTLTCTTPSL